MIQELRNYFIGVFEPELLDEIAAVAVVYDLEEGVDLISPGDSIKSIPLLLEGTIKILRPDDQGDELLLYHIEKGDTCAVTLNCCLGNTRSEIHAVTETSVRLLMIPISKMELWSSKYKSWRNFMYNSYHQRMMELLESIDTIAFQKMDERLENYLKDKSVIHRTNQLPITHQQIANDLHTSRVVVSRLLKKMENDHKLKLHRGFMELL